MQLDSLKEPLRQFLTSTYDEAVYQDALACIQPSIKKANLIQTITFFQQAHPDFYQELFEWHGHIPHIGERLGRGELLCYFLFHDVKLGGATSSTDLHVNGKEYLEIKSVKPIGERYTDFSLGAAELLPSYYFLQQLMSVQLKLKDQVPLDNPLHVSKKKLNLLRQLQPEIIQHEAEYLEALFKTEIRSKKYLFFNQHTSLPIHVGKLRKSQLKIDRISSGMTRVTFKP